MDIDSIQINFSEDSLFALNICLAFLMFSVALDIQLSDFKRITKTPKAAAVGLFSEYLLLPLLTIALVFVFSPETPSMALGMILIAVCPGGSTSNFMVSLAKGNTALSIILTSITTVLAVIITPFAFQFWASFIPSTTATPELAIEPVKMMKIMVSLILIPVSLGVFLNERKRAFADKIRKCVKGLSMVLFFGVVVVAIFKNWEHFLTCIHLVFIIVLVHNGLALLMGYSFAKLWKLPEIDCRAISIETGIQNTGLGLILVFNFFDGIGGMAIMLAWWGVWHLITGFGLSTFWSKRALE